MNVNTDVMRKLAEKYRDDAEAMELLEEALISFEEYHTAICKMEIKRKLYGTSERDVIQELDRRRTTYHNAVLSNLRILNRLAEREGLPAFYDGVVSEEQPYRRQAADAVLKYVEQIVADRI